MMIYNKVNSRTALHVETEGVIVIGIKKDTSVKNVSPKEN